MASALLSVRVGGVEGVRDRAAELTDERARERDDRDRGGRGREMGRLLGGERRGREPDDGLRRLGGRARPRGRPATGRSRTGRVRRCGNRDERPERPAKERDVEPSVRRPKRDDGRVGAVGGQDEVDDRRRRARRSATRDAHGVGRRARRRPVGVDRRGTNRVGRRREPDRRESAHARHATGGTNRLEGEQRWRSSQSATRLRRSR